ncbi:winged helix-turn-helix domain-containing protein [Dactylosporangium sp. NPDC005572]|uniref:winged helix-turn-helix domain-containing protein n=1 Tax=Dactylosporangium sp. NPDC005572 TaxID=3156889 RepID=UPI0033AC0BFD
MAEDIRQAIRDGRYTPGSKLPVRRLLIEQYSVSGQVIDSAMLVLKAEGWVRGHQGRGTYVADNPPTA